jgi:hypothetical protein
MEEAAPCRWMDEAGVCMLDGLACEICESYEPKTLALGRAVV